MNRHFFKKVVIINRFKRFQESDIFHDLKIFIWIFNSKGSCVYGKILEFFADVLEPDLATDNMSGIRAR